MERYHRTRGNTFDDMKKHSEGRWVKFEDVAKLVIKLTQDRTWNDPSIEPIEREECFIMLSDGEIKPALMIAGEWIKVAGYPFDFDFNKDDVIKWRYDLQR